MRQTCVGFHTCQLAVFIASLLIADGFADSDSVVGWRNDGSGQFPESQPPVSWGEDQLIWKTELASPSMSSPVVAGEYVFTMAEPTELICLRSSDGSILWRRTHQYADFMTADEVREIEQQHSAGGKVRTQIEDVQKQLKEAQDRKAPQDETQLLEAQIASLQEQYERLTPFPPPSTDSTGNTTGTPASDSQSVWCVLSNGIVSCHDFEGKRRWMTFVEKPSPRHTSSPLLVDDRLIVHLKHLIALEDKTGKILWKRETPARMGTSTVLDLGPQKFIVTPAGALVRLSDGKLTAEGLFDLPYCSPLVEDGVIYAVERGAVKAIRVTIRDGQETQVEKLWQTRGAEGDQLASPVLHQGLLYSVTGNGILEVLDAATGARVYRKRLDFAQGRVDPSLALAGQAVFVSSTSGKTFAFKPGRDYESLAESELEGTSSSPFFHGSRAYIRSPKYLHCIGQ